MHTFSRINHIKATLDQDRPVDPAIGRNPREDLSVRWIDHSGSNEGTMQSGQGIEVSSRTGEVDRFSTEQILYRASYSTAREIFHKHDCASRTMCDNPSNRPATPLEEAHQGGCFIFRGCCG